MNGRFAAALLVEAAQALGIHLVLDTAFAVFIMLSASAWCMANIAGWFLEGTEDDNGCLTAALVQAGCIAGFCNVFIAEWYQFTECLLIYAAAAVCCVSAARCLDQNKKIAAFLLLSAGYNFYQPALAFFVYLILLLILKKYRFRFAVQAVKETAAAALLCGGVFAINFFAIRLLGIYGLLAGESRYNQVGLDCIAANLKLLLEHQKLLWIQANGMMPAPLLAVSMGILVFLAAAAFLQNGQGKAADACFITVMLAGGIFVVFLPIIMLDTFWMAPRSVVPLFFSYTVLAGYLGLQGKTWVKAAACCCLCILLMSMLHDTHRYGRDIHTNNSMDKQYIHMVQEKIEDYERQSQTRVEYLGFSQDANIRWRWDLCGDYAWDVLPRILTVEWAKVDAFNYYEQESYQLTEVPESYARYFMQNDWDRPDVEAQVCFDGNKCYIAVF